MATCTEGREAPATTSARSNTAGPLAPSARQATDTKIRAPHPEEKVAVAQERVSKLQAALRAVGDDDDTAPNLREALKKARQQAVPLSDRVDTVECRGRQRGASVGDASSRVGAPPVSSCRSRHVRRGAEVACSSGTVVEGEGRWPSPNRPESQAGVSSGRFRPTVRRGDARVDPRPTEGSARGHRGRPFLRSGEDLPTHVFSSTGVATDLPRTTFCDAICSSEYGEVISLQCGMTCVRVGEAANCDGPGRESPPSTGQFFRRQ